MYNPVMTKSARLNFQHSYGPRAIESTLFACLPALLAIVQGLIMVIQNLTLKLPTMHPYDPCLPGRCIPHTVHSTVHDYCLGPTQPMGPSGICTHCRLQHSL